MPCSSHNTRTCCCTTVGCACVETTACADKYTCTHSRTCEREHGQKRCYREPTYALFTRYPQRMDAQDVLRVHTAHTRQHAWVVAESAHAPRTSICSRSSCNSTRLISGGTTFMSVRTARLETGTVVATTMKENNTVLWFGAQNRGEHTPHDTHGVAHAPHWVCTLEAGIHPAHQEGVGSSK